jgi:hypothetical protein
VGDAGEESVEEAVDAACDGFGKGGGFGLEVVGLGVAAEE